MWRNYDAWGNSLTPQRPVSPTAAPLPVAPPTVTPNWFADGDFVIEYEPPEPQTTDKKQPAQKSVTSRFKKSSKRRSRRRAPMVESDIYALSSDED